MGYCEDSKSFRIYVPSKRKVEFNHDVIFDEDAALAKAINLPLSPIDEKKDDETNQDDEAVIELDNEPIEPMDSLDHPPNNPPFRKKTFVVKRYSTRC